MPHVQGDGVVATAERGLGLRDLSPAADGAGMMHVVLRCACGWSASDIGQTSQLHTDARAHLERAHPERVRSRGFGGHPPLAEVLRCFLSVEYAKRRTPRRIDAEGGRC